MSCTQSPEQALAGLIFFVSFARVPLHLVVVEAEPRHVCRKLF